MGKDKKKAPPPSQTAVDVRTTAKKQYDDLMSKPSAVESELTPLSQDYANYFRDSVARQTKDYGDIMTGYQDFSKGLTPTRFSFDPVKYKRPEELTEGFGYLREAVPGYRDFAKTGGYSDQDIQELRARSTSPIRAAYGNTQMQLDRSRALGGAGGSPNYIAAVSRAQRELPGQMADAQTNINAQLADQIRQGKLAGLAGISGIGSTMGGLSQNEAQMIQQALLANQAADLQAKGMTESSLQNMRQNQLASLAGQSGLYGTTPGQASMFGNQVLNAYQARSNAESQRNQMGLSLLDTQLRSAGAQQELEQKKGNPWWKTALSVAATVAPYVAMAASSRELKEDIKPASFKVSDKLKKLPLYTWKYKGDKVKHFGPIAEEFKETFGVGDGKTLHLADVMGVVLASQQEALNDA